MHIHVSEQAKEVEECVAWCGRTPIAQLDRTIGLGEQWNLVHVTHATEEEIERITEARATVTLCPSTEANLGDGFFSADDFFRRGGVFGIGSDSQISVDPREELRLFEYGRRLNAQRRALSADRTTPNSGAWLWLRAAEAGGRPSAAPLGKLAAGHRADMLVLDAEAPSLVGRAGDTLLDAFVFATHGSPAIRDVIVGGKRIVQFGHHYAEEQAEENFRRAWEKWKIA
jgi:formimidoylglutamate deiminase